MPRRRPASQAAAPWPSYVREARTRTSSCSRPTTSSARTSPLAPLQPPEVHRRQLRERRRRTSLEHTGDSLVQTDTLRRSRPRRHQQLVLQRSSRPVRERQRAGQSRTAPIRKRRSIRAGRRVLTIGRNIFSPRETTIKRNQIADTRDLTHRRPHVQGRLRLQPGQDPQLLPGQLLRLLHASTASPISTNGARPASLPAGLRRRRARPAPTTHPDIEEYARSSFRTNGRSIRS